jgi:propionate CoA-transferase
MSDGQHSMKRMRPPRVLSADEAAALIPDRAVVAIQGSGGGVGEPTSVLRAVRRRFDRTQQPRELTLCHATGLGDKREIGTDLLAVPGLVRRDIAGHLGMAPRMGRMILDNEIESYNFPQGAISQMFGAVAARKPGVFTRVGLGTFVDPRIEGGRMNARTREALVRVIELDGREWLFFPAWKIDVALVRGTAADLNGNIVCDGEASILEGIKIAQAAQACGGIVIAQVKHLARSGTLDARRVRIPGVSVDYLVVDPGQKQTCLEEYNPSFCGETRIPLQRLPPLPLDVRKVVARRAARELTPGAVVNLGVGMPDGVASIATEEGLIDRVTFTVEQGIVGGMPAGGVVFGVAYNPQAIIAEDDQFGFYDGGGLDVAFLGMAETDAAGNVNVSKVGPLLSGCGGFINISQNARKVVFCGTFTAKGLECVVGGGSLRIAREGAIRKFVRQVEQITFSGAVAKQDGRPVLYVTERAVFELTPEGVVLREVAPGVDLQRDILDRMDFAPIVPDAVATMDPAIFS